MSESNRRDNMLDAGLCVFLIALFTGAAVFALSTRETYTDPEVFDAVTATLLYGGAGAFIFASIGALAAWQNWNARLIPAPFILWALPLIVFIGINVQWLTVAE